MRDIASRHGCGSWAPKWQLDHQLALLRTFFETHGAPPQSWKGFGVSIVARVEDNAATTSAWGVVGRYRGSETGSNAQAGLVNRSHEMD
jgi:hypothetical protein